LPMLKNIVRCASIKTVVSAFVCTHQSICNSTANVCHAWTWYYPKMCYIMSTNPNCNTTTYVLHLNFPLPYGHFPSTSVKYKSSARAKGNFKMQQRFDFSTINLQDQSRKCVPTQVEFHLQNCKHRLKVDSMVNLQHRKCWNCSIVHVIRQ